MTTFLTRRRSLALLSTLATTCAMGGWPTARANTRQVRVIVPYPPGGGADTLARILTARAGQLLGDTFVIENRGGAGGTLGAAVAATAPADGQTLLWDATGHVINPFLYPRLPYNTTTDLLPVFLAARLPNILVAHPSVKANTVAEVIAMAKAAPGALDFASSGNGTVQHLAIEMFQRQAGVQLNHIAYKGGSPALTDLVGGHVKFFFSNAAACTAYIRNGSVKAIAHTATGRLPFFPSMPAVADTLPGFEAYEWNGVFAPKGTTAAAIAALNKGFNQAILDPEVKTRMESFSALLKPNTPAEFARFREEELQRWGTLVKAAHITLE